MGRRFRYTCKRKPYTTNEVGWKVTKLYRAKKRQYADHHLTDTARAQEFVEALQLYAASTKHFTFKLVTMLKQHGVGIGMDADSFEEYAQSCKDTGMLDSVDYNAVWRKAMELSYDQPPETLLANLSYCLGEATLVAQAKQLPAVGAAASALLAKPPICAIVPL